MIASSIFYLHFRLRLRATCFCDSDPLKHGTTFCGLPVIPHEGLATMGRDTHVFVSNNYIAPVVFIVKQMGFGNIYHCIDLLEAVDFAGSNVGMSASQIHVLIERHKADAMILTAPTDEPALRTPSRYSVNLSTLPGSGQKNGF